MKVSEKKVSDITVEELKSIIHDVIIEDFETFRETIEIMANKKLMKQIKQADKDWVKPNLLVWQDLYGFLTIKRSTEYNSILSSF